MKAPYPKRPVPGGRSGGRRQTALLFTALAAVALAACQTADVPRDPTVLSGPAFTADQCRPAAERQLAALGIADSDIESLQHFKDERDIRLRNGQEITRLRGIDSWADLASCTGYVVIDHRPDCSVERVWTRGDCRVP